MRDELILDDIEIKSSIWNENKFVDLNIELIYSHNITTLNKKELTNLIEFLNSIKEGMN